MTAAQRRLKRAALRAAREQGCTCRPVISLVGNDPFWHAQVAHDDWCPAIRSQEYATPGVPTGPVVFVPPGWDGSE